ncbi:ImmA/IrrE family metallo-endopeptidase [Jeotgalibacillus campisalis]|uniref:IrrE N-terminal-like domain-containing protein n=1 Tax=Jeotgalibacillus campisalis TaxID=220754 RepID=A0A0C2RWQ9_9BACL|nr:ImmA/IrrE family metallo-endopeptidase [Jeotgalibacillus campisalis]KIL46199.1 hypothetical protein KR50_28740 [Jeotgalibacillus campisalis]
MRYVQTGLEDKIQEIYESLGIYRTSQIDIENIASRMGFALDYILTGSYSTELPDGTILICLDIRLNERQLWAAFCHELGHVLEHAGNQFQLHKLFCELQENRSNLFECKFAVPIHLARPYIDPLPTRQERISEIMKRFPVEYDLAEKRLQIYESNYVTI